MTNRVIQYRIRPDGAWQVVLPGVYRDGRGALTDQQRAVAAFLYAGRAIAITGLAAVSWQGIKVGRCDFVDVLVPLHHRRCDAGFARLHRTSVEPGALFKDGPVVYAALDRAIVDAVRQITDLPEIRELVASAVQRGKVLITHLARQLDAGPAAGSARLRLVLAEVADGVRSTAEADLRTLIIQSRLPAPLYNPSLYVGGEFLARPDGGGQPQALLLRSIPWPGTCCPPTMSAPWPGTTA